MWVLASASHAAAVRHIEAVVQAESLDCDFLRVDGYLVPGTSSKDGELEKELEAKNKCLLEQPVRPPMSPIPNRSNTEPLNYVDEGGACGTGQLNLAASRFRSKYRRSNSSNTSSSSNNEKEYSRK